MTTLGMIASNGSSSSKAPIAEASLRCGCVGLASLALTMALAAGTAHAVAAEAGGGADRTPRLMSKARIAPAFVAGHVYVNAAEGTRIIAKFADTPIPQPRNTSGPIWINDGPICQSPFSPSLIFLNTSIRDDSGTPSDASDDQILPAITMNWGDIRIGEVVSGISFTTTADRAANFDSNNDGTADAIGDVDTVVVLFDREDGFSSSAREAVFAFRLDDIPAPTLNPSPDFAVYEIMVDFNFDLTGSPIALRNLGTRDLDGDGLGDFGWGQYYVTSVGGDDAGITAGTYLDRFGQAFAEPVGYPNSVPPEAQGVEDWFDIHALNADFAIESELASDSGTYYFGGRECPIAAASGAPLAAFEFTLFTGTIGPPCPEIDFSLDGTVDSGDLAAFIGGFIAGDVAFDLTGDGQVDSGDLAAFITLFLECTAG